MAKDWSDMSEKMVARIAEVRESMEQTAKGDTLQTKQNCVLALREDPLFGGAKKPE